MLDKTKRYLVVGLGLLGGKYALELTRAGFHVDGINRSEGHLQYALEHGYIAGGKTHDFEDLVFRHLHQFSKPPAVRFHTGFLELLTRNAVHAVDRFDHMHRNTNRAGLIGNASRDGLTNPPRSIS